MGNPFILRKGVSSLNDLVDGPYGALNALKGVNGKLLFVNSQHASSSDSNDGTDPSAPLKTIAAAYALCTDEAQDVIYVSGRCRYRETELEILKGGIRIIGAGWGTEWNQTAASDKYVVRVAAENVVISNLQISVNDQGGGIYVGDVATGGVNYNAFGCLIENCFIRGDWYTAGGNGASVGTGVYNHGASLMTVKDCLIWGWTNGIWIEGGDSRTSYGARVIGNDILYCKTYGIFLQGAGYPSLIRGNTIADQTTSTALTRAISLNNSTGNVAVVGNYIAAANANYDSGNLNIWAGNFVEVTATASEVRSVSTEAY